MTNYTRIGAIGSAVISFLTLVAGLYLFISLMRQGRGKLRVRLLLGMVVSDICIGLAVLPGEIAYIAGHPLVTGRATCDVVGFFVTSVLFTQHLWTLSIAIATFLLLKHPLSRFTMAAETYSWLAAPLIWGVSFIHAGAWQGTIGFVSSGNLCYYGGRIVPGTSIDSRDLVQFIPRAFVFVVICCLYSMLFTFLRRPDTIQLSSHFVSGTALSDREYADDGATHPTHSRGSVGEQGAGGAGKNTVTGRVKRGISRLHSSGNKQAQPINPDAPWEALEFVQVGSHNPLLSSKPSSPAATHPSQLAPLASSGILLHQPLSTPTSRPATTTSSPHQLGTPFSEISPDRRPSAISISEPPYSTTSSQRPSETETIVAPELAYHIGSYPEGTKPPISPASHMTPHHVLSPVISDGKSDFGESVSPSHSSRRLDMADAITEGDEVAAAFAASGLGNGGTETRRHSGQTLKEFFQEFQVPAGGDQNESGLGAGGGTRVGLQMSATAYFNRQASLLMLYFPLAYMVVFSMSLVRLVYDMVHGTPSPILQLLSSWMVLSVGLIDGLVYGLAEFLVRRRVRRKMPDRMG